MTAIRRIRKLITCTLLASIALGAGAWAGTQSEANVTIDRARDALSAAQVGRILTVTLIYRTPPVPGMPPPLADPCAMQRPGVATPGCEIDRVEFGLDAPAVRASVCRREIVEVSPHAQPAFVRAGAVRLALGEDCAAIPTDRFALLQDSRGAAAIDGSWLDSAADVLLLLRDTQRRLAHNVEASGHSWVFIEDCRTELPTNALGRGCDGGSAATFSRLPLDRIFFIRRDDSATGARRWPGDAHWEISMLPDGVGPYWELQLDSDAAGRQVRARIVWRAPSPV